MQSAFQIIPTKHFNVHSIALGHALPLKRKWVFDTYIQHTLAQPKLEIFIPCRSCTPMTIQYLEEKVQDIESVQKNILLRLDNIEKLIRGQELEK